MQTKAWVLLFIEQQFERMLMKGEEIWEVNEGGELEKKQNCTDLDSKGGGSTSDSVITLSG